MRANDDNRKSGVALIVTLGMLTILTVLAVAFAIAMRVERVAARNYANSIRAKCLIQAAFSRALQDIDVSMTNPVVNVYPAWTNRHPRTIWDAMGTTSAKSNDLCNTHDCKDLLAGEALGMVPESVRPAALAMQQHGNWIDVVTTNAGVVTRHGKIAYMNVNHSGLVDANYAGGRKRIWSTDSHEMQLWNQPDFVNSNQVVKFLTDRTNAHVRYETPTELGALNPGVIKSVSNLFTFSYDPGPDVFFYTNGVGQWWNKTDTAVPPKTMGRRDALLQQKFDINSIKNYLGYTKPNVYNGYSSDTNFMAYYYTPLMEMLRKAGIERPDDVAWNIVNYLDPDRVPQGGMADNRPWTHTEGGEALPLINEIVLSRSKGGLSNHYEFAVEVWFPFAPATVEPGDNFKLQVGVFDHLEATALPIDVMKKANTNWSFTVPIPQMRYGTNTEFLVFVSPPNKQISFPKVVGGTTSYLPMSDSNCVYFLARVVKVDTIYSGIITNPVDEAMGYVPSSEGGQWADDKRKLKKFTGPIGYSVCDPRVNGQVKYWTQAGTGGKNIGGIEYPPTSPSNTLGKINVNCEPWKYNRQGLPIFAKDGPMLNAAELGYIFRSNLDDEEWPEWRNFYWRTINLMHRSEGAALLDWIAVRPTNVSARGRFCVSSRQTNALMCVIRDLQIGHTNVVNAKKYKVPKAALENVVRVLIRNGPYVNFKDMFTDDKPAPDFGDGGGGPLADAFRACCPVGATTNDIMKEDTFRQMVELLSFRQNVYTIFMAARPLAPDGKTILAEERAAAIVYRDAYTGRHFVRQFKWLSD